MSNSPLLTNYVSEIDQLLIKFDQEHPKLSASQQKERQKSLRVAKLRDNPQAPETTTNLWEGF